MFNIQLLMFSVILLMVSCLLTTAESTSNRTCNYTNQIFQECDVMFYTNWTICDGKGCPIGQQTRGKGICCIQDNMETGQALKNRCMQNCNFTDEDFQETVPTNVTPEIENKQSEITLKGVSIAGAVIGVLAISGLLGLLIFFLCRRWKKKKENPKVEPEERDEK
ncbi:uncharacterized protein LOC128187030 [Crassostrea angulata]|uniref:uncharacterized protein LOC128187030 n=1 Tax=Magallana angulata TaxID=2784310 RepID=UPI0022B0F496|nr:uncharacterized protein LOC128187030 [Crassostrea angulata]